MSEAHSPQPDADPQTEPQSGPNADSAAKEATEPTHEDLSPPDFLVAIGASAGGLEALESLFDHLPDVAGLAYVVISHLSPDFKSLLDELLARRTRMPVRLVEEGMLLQRNEVYVIPPGKEMIVAGERLYLSDREIGDRAPLPINAFLRSLAREWGNRAIAVVLSGSGSDGAQGVKEVNQAGGFAIAQSPETAAFDSMPQAAIKTGAVTSVLAPTEMGRAIVAHTQDAAPRLTADAHADANPDTAHYRKIMQIIYGAEDVDFSGYKLPTFRRRVSRRMSACNCATLSDYIAVLTQDQAEIKRLSDDLLIGVTSFFRDPEAFDTMRAKALESLMVAKAAANAPMRVWIAGCATGEEAYSVAITIEEVRRALKLDLTIQIFATDIRRDFLEKAGRGIYSTHEMGGIPDRMRETYFNAVSGDSYQIDPSVRKLVIFAPHDLMRDPPFTKVDLITCRNVLIYFNAEFQKRIIVLFNFALTQDGMLFLGPSEALGELEQYFSAIDAHWRVYRKASSRILPLSTAASTGLSRQNTLHDPSARALTRQTHQGLMPAYLAMLKRYGPPSALITTDRHIVHAIGKGRDHLRPPEGAISLDILDLVDPGLRAPLATGIERCRREGVDIVFPDLALKEGKDPNRHVRLSIHPLKEKENSEITHFVVIFEDLEADRATENAGAIQLELSDASRERITSLEDDLKRTRESLQASIEEIETSNEELQSSNEELMASNEELQSTNEELSSVNEELHSVNAEYLRQNEKLTMLHHDMESLLRAVDVGVIFVNRQQVIRRFTAGAERVFGLIAEDVGRRIGDLRTQFREFDASAMINRAIAEGGTVENEYQFEDGSWWLIRCVAHDATHDGAGVILMAINIDRVKIAELEAQSSRKRYELVGTLSKAFTFTSMVDGRITEPQPEWEAYTGQTFRDAKGYGWLDAVHKADRPRLKALWTQGATADPATDRNTRFSAYRLWHGESETWRYVQSRAVRVPSTGEGPEYWYRVILDAEDIIKAEIIREHNEGVIQALMAVSSDLAAYIDPTGKIEFVRPDYVPHTDTSVEQLKGQFLLNVVRQSDREQLAPHVEAALAGRPGTLRLDDESTGETWEWTFEPHVETGTDTVGVAVGIRNISALRETYAEDTARLELLARLIDRVDEDVILFVPSTLEITFANKRARNALRYPEHQLVGKAITDLLPEFSKNRMVSLVESADTKDQHSTFLLRYDGTTYDARIAIGVEMDPSTSENVGVMITRDVTEQRAVAEELRERTADLATSNRDLEQFAFAISHDLKAPLRHITSFAGLLKKQTGDSIPEKGIELLDQIVESSGRMRTMIDSLLAYCRIQRTEQFKTVSLADAASDAIANLTDPIQDVDALIEGLEDLPKVKGDRALLTMLVQNLIENALKYRGTARPEVRFSAKRGRGTWRIAVEDNGIGIDSAHGEDVFQVFRRLHPSDGSGSTGIGLAACRRIVEIHRGRIWLDTGYTDGARFIFELPNMKTGSGRKR